MVRMQRLIQGGRAVNSIQAFSSLKTIGRDKNQLFCRYP